MGFWKPTTATTRLAAYYEVRPVFVVAEPMTGASGLVFDPGSICRSASRRGSTGSSALVAFGRRRRRHAAGGEDDVAGARDVRDWAAAGPGQPHSTSPATGSMAAAAPTSMRGSCCGAAALAGAVPPVRLGAARSGTQSDLAGQSLGGASASFEMQRYSRPTAGNLDVVPGSIRCRSRSSVSRDPIRTTVSTLSESNQTVVSLGRASCRATRPTATPDLDPPRAAVDMTPPLSTCSCAVDGVLYGELGAFAGTRPTRPFRPPRARRGQFPACFPACRGVRTHPVRLVVNGAESQPFWR
jgi:hypothetical protein